MISIGLVLTIMPIGVDKPECLTAFTSAYHALPFHTPGPVPLLSPQFTSLRCGLGVPSTQAVALLWSSQKTRPQLSVTQRVVMPKPIIPWLHKPPLKNSSWFLLFLYTCVHGRHMCRERCVYMCAFMYKWHVWCAQCIYVCDICNVHAHLTCDVYDVCAYEYGVFMIYM